MYRVDPSSENCCDMRSYFERENYINVGMIMVSVYEHSLVQIFVTFFVLLLLQSMLLNVILATLRARSRTRTSVDQLNSQNYIAEPRI